MAPVAPHTGARGDGAGDTGDAGDTGEAGNTGEAGARDAGAGVAPGGRGHARAATTTPPAAGADADPVGGPAPAGAPVARSGASRWAGLRLAALAAVIVAPLAVGLAALRRPRWYPILDLAMTELRVRDVFTSRTPLIGLPGRIGVLGQKQGSHPGPLSFWLLAPVYRLLGSSAWAMEVGTVVLHLAAIALALWLAHRRGGQGLALGLAAGLAVLVRSYGASALTQPWNPYLPLLWWTVVLLAVWCVLCGDMVGLPVAVAAGSLAAQTHLPYVGLAGGMGLLALVGVVLAFRRAEPGGPRRRVAFWLGGSIALGLVLWSGPIIDQLTVEPANGTLLVDYFRNPPEDPVGLATGVRMLLLHLDVWRLVTAQGANTPSLAAAASAPAGSLVPGAVVLALFGASAVAAWRLRHRALVRLHVVVAFALGLGAVSISRIFGLLWYYLMIWAWGITTLLVVAVGWTLAEVVRRRLAPGARLRAARVAAGGLVVVLVTSSTVLGVDAASVDQPAPQLSAAMAGIVPKVVAQMADGSRPGLGRDERYLVTWTDAMHIGSQGIALVDELERDGFDVGVLSSWAVPVGRSRARTRAQATSLVHLATGRYVERWRAKPGVVQLASVDLRTPAQRAEFERLRSRAIVALRAAGRSDVVANVDANLFAAAIDPRIPGDVADELSRMLDIGGPTAVFVAPPDTAD
ncbi:MAG: hypothetical protein HYX34_07585 [Actinobacteria bacterium]|nr:hypothetical protein [Actinomycetota bacterium]